GRLELAPIADRLARGAEDVAERLELRPGLLERPFGVVERLPPMAGQEEEEQRLPTPAVERVLERDVVADRLVHLAAPHAEHPVMHPDASESVAERARLRDLVLVVRELEVEPTAVDLEARAEV